MLFIIDTPAATQQSAVTASSECWLCARHPFLSIAQVSQRVDLNSVPGAPDLQECGVLQPSFQIVHVTMFYVYLVL